LSFTIAKDLSEDNSGFSGMFCRVAKVNGGLRRRQKAKGKREDGRRPAFID
jgi:hypothetical protein